MTTRFSHLRRTAPLSVSLLLVIAGAVLAAAGGARAAERCPHLGRWMVPGQASIAASGGVIAEMAQRPIVLLGESHASIEDHRWQLHTLAALWGRHPAMVIGFEMFPRAAQPVLDRWVAGELRVAEFLEAARWNDVWGYDADLYLPLFHFARQNRISMRAINIDRRIIGKIARRGWDALPPAERGGITDPAPAGAAYRDDLAKIFALHGAGADADGGEEADRRAAFERFVEAQIAWDRAMAEGLAEARRLHPGALVVGIAGRGHVEFGHGIAHQLADLGIAGSAALLTAEVKQACPELETGVADAVFLVARVDTIEQETPRLRLGVVIESGDDGVRVTRVVEGSVAEAAALRDRDIIVTAAGLAVRQASELVAIVTRQAPGTWLPLEIRRDGETLEIVAKFPSRMEVGE